MSSDSFDPDMPPYPFVPPFDPPGSEPPYIPAGRSTAEDGSSDDSSNDDFGPRPPWWPDDYDWPPRPDEPVVIETPPSPHIWPRLPPDHPYYLPPGYSYPDNLPLGHPGALYPERPDYPVVHPGDGNDDYPRTLDEPPPNAVEE